MAREQPTDDFWWLPKKQEPDGNKNRGFTDASQRGFYLTPWWRARRADKLIRDPFCEQCNKDKIYTLASIVDHKTPIPRRCNFTEFVKLSGFNDLQSLCEPCHRSKTAYDRHGRKKMSKTEIHNNMKKFEQ